MARKRRVYVSVNTNNYEFLKNEAQGRGLDEHGMANRIVNEWIAENRSEN